MNAPSEEVPPPSDPLSVLGAHEEGPGCWCLPVLDVIGRVTLVYHRRWPGPGAPDVGAPGAGAPDAGGPGIGAPE